MALIATPPKLQFFDTNGNPLVGGKLYSYAAGTVTPLATFTDAGGGTPNANPVILDSRGEASVWLGTASYKFKLTTATNVDIWTVDNIAGVLPTFSVFGTGVAATDHANLQAAVNTLPRNGVLNLFGSFTLNDTVILKPRIEIRNGSGAVINVTSQVSAFRLRDDMSTQALAGDVAPVGMIWTGDVALGVDRTILDAFPGDIKFSGFFEIYGPGIPAVGAPDAEPLGTLTYLNVRAAVQIEINGSCVDLDLFVHDYFAGVYIKDAYQSRVTGKYGQCRHGIMLVGFTHDCVLANPFVDGIAGSGELGKFLTGLSLNYGWPGPRPFTKYVSSHTGAYQNCDVGVWIEQCDQFMGVGTIYTEGNRVSDFVNGRFGDAGDPFFKAADFTQLQGLSLSSPCSSPRNPPLGSGPNGINLIVSWSNNCKFGGLFHAPGAGAPTGRPIVADDSAGSGNTYEFTSLVAGSGTIGDLFDLAEPGRHTVILPGGDRHRFNTGTFLIQRKDIYGDDPGEQGAWGDFWVYGQSGRKTHIVSEPRSDNVDALMVADEDFGGTRVGLAVRRTAGNAIERVFIVNPASNRLEMTRPLVALAASAVVGQNAALPTIASAATVVPAEPTSFVSGTAAIANITLPSGFPNAGRLTLIPLAAFTTVATGNINRAVTAVVGQPIDFIWDGASAKWYVKT